MGSRVTENEIISLNNEECPEQAVGSEDVIKDLSSTSVLPPTSTADLAMREWTKPMSPTSGVPKAGTNFWK